MITGFDIRNAMNRSFEIEGSANRGPRDSDLASRDSNRRIASLRRLLAIFMG
jgi:hypothetical protein